jgi:hypothetical protein
LFWGVLDGVGNTRIVHGAAGKQLRRWPAALFFVSAAACDCHIVKRNPDAAKPYLSWSALAGAVSLHRCANFRSPRSIRGRPSLQRDFQRQMLIFGFEPTARLGQVADKQGECTGGGDPCQTVRDDSGSPRSSPHPDGVFRKAKPQSRNMVGVA